MVRRKQGVYRRNARTCTAIIVGMTDSRWMLDEQHVMQLIQPAAVFGVAFAVMLLTRHLLLRAIRRRIAGPASWAAVSVTTLRLPSLFWALAAALQIGVHFAHITEKTADQFDKWIGAFLIISFTLVAMSIAVRLVTVYGEREQMPFAAVGLSRTLIRTVVLALGLMTLLATLGKSITPVLTALGVGGLAVALALQDTLANFFAGIHILVERPVFVGDMIRLENGLEGVVSDIGWRTTRLRTGSNDMVIIPNTKITSGILVNYSLPERRGVAEVGILAGQGADVDVVRRIALEEAVKVDGVFQDPAPAFLFDPGVLPTHLHCKLFVNVANRQDQGRVASDIRLRLLARFRAEGVPLPEPGLLYADRR